MNIRTAYLAIAALLVLGTGMTTFAATSAKKRPARILTAVEKSLVGSYRCRSYNVSGGSGNCRLAPPLTLSADGTYRMSSEKGTFRIAKRKLVLSGSKLRGPGTLSANPSTITFSYLYKGWRHTISYQKVGVAAVPVPAEQRPAVPVELDISFPAEDGSVDWINVITLVPQGQTPEAAPYRPESLAVQDATRRTVHASFFGQKEVRTGAVYTVYAGSGFELRKVGVIDLTSATGMVKSVISAFPAATIGLPELQSPPSESKASVSPPSPSSDSVPSSSKTCNPLVPRYAGGC